MLHKTRRKNIKVISVLLVVLLGVFVIIVATIGSGLVGATASHPPLPPAKQAAQDQQDTAVAVAAKIYPTATLAPNLTAAFLAIPTLPPQPTPDIKMTGLLNYSDDPYPGAYAVMKNEWIDTVNGTLTAIYAGHYTEHPEQGFVAVQTGKMMNHDYAIKEYPSPVKEGALRITAANYPLFTIQTAKGTILTFNLQKLAFN